MPPVTVNIPSVLPVYHITHIPRPYQLLVANIRPEVRVGVDGKGDNRGKEKERGEEKGKTEGQKAEKKDEMKERNEEENKALISLYFLSASEAMHCATAIRGLNIIAIDANNSQNDGGDRFESFFLNYVLKDILTAMEYHGDNVAIKNNTECNDLGGIHGLPPDGHPPAGEIDVEKSVSKVDYNSVTEYSKKGEKGEKEGSKNGEYCNMDEKKGNMKKGNTSKAEMKKRRMYMRAMGLNRQMGQRHSNSCAKYEDAYCISCPGVRNTH